MFDKRLFQECLEKYKQRFPEIWPDENYKWEAVTWFQGNWDIHAPDFPGMLKNAISPAHMSILLAGAGSFPGSMIVELAQDAPEQVRAMFIDLFDETQDLWPRIAHFKQEAERIRVAVSPKKKSHYQNESTIMTYLWLEFPDKYYIYKFEIAKVTCAKLKGNYTFKKGAYSENIRNFCQFYDELAAELLLDQELRTLFSTYKTDSCWSDSNFHTLTIDFCHFIAKYMDTDNEITWWPKDYNPGISVQDWVKLLKNPDVFTFDSLKIMKRLMDFGGTAACSQLAEKYGESHTFYSSGSVALAKRIVKITNCPVMTDSDENSKWWPVLYVGKNADKNEKGTYIWKLRKELQEAMKRADLSDIPLYAEDAKGPQHYWFLNANPKIWSMTSMPVGQVQHYTLFNQNGNKRRIFQNFLDAKAGDLVIGYESTPVKQIVAVLKVNAAQDGENIYFEKLEGLSVPIDYAALKACPELAQMEYFTMTQGSLFKLTETEFDFIMDMIREENTSPVSDAKPSYTKEDFLREVYMDASQYDRLKAVLLKKKNIILQGAPGVGKTFTAKRLAYSIMGQADDDRIEFVQFHQNYSYEDFVMGYKPVEDGFELKYGVFYRFCQKAANHPDKDYFFIIDEINRGNLSKIFGELLMLIEADYRDQAVTLAYNGLPFSVPKRLHIIGMMNTADRSLAMIDYALRRRFSFFNMEPGFDSKGFRDYQESLNNETFNLLIDRIQDLNQNIIRDKSLGKGFCIGHSYFCNAGKCTEEWMRDVVDFDILPMLSEYWFDDDEKVQRWENILRGVFL